MVDKTTSWAAKSANVPRRARARKNALAACRAEGRREVARLQKEIAKFERVRAALENDLSLLRFQLGLAQSALELLDAE